MGTFHGVMARSRQPGPSARTAGAEKLVRRSGPLLTCSLLFHQSARDRGSSGVANIKSQIKRNRQNEAARLRNKAVKSELKTAVRRFREAADSGDATSAGAALKSASRLLDKAASKGVIHKNQAANRKAAMAHRASSL
jgi:small subunit ribosomal protein S20